MTGPERLTGNWTPRRQAQAYEHVLEAISRARHSVREFDPAGQCARDKALRAAADALAERSDELLQHNQADLDEARDGGLSAGGLDRLALTTPRLARLADYLRQIADMPNPLAEELPTRSAVVRVPLGVIGVIYEPHPATTLLASAPLLKAGNAVLLRGSPTAARTDTALTDLLRDSLDGAGAPQDSLQALPVSERSTVRYLVSAHGQVDLVLLRAGVSLARRARGDASVPLLDLGHGICHIYLDATTSADLAHQVVLQASLSHPSSTGAAHTVLVHSDAAPALLPDLLAALTRAGVVLHGNEQIAATTEGIVAITDNDWRDEYLSPELAVHVVDSFDAAIEHINRYGTGHTETITTGDHACAREFATRVNAATIAINTVADPPELFITQRTHTRGPLHPSAFTTTKQIAWAT
jgi:glutamate-5-semialdehyde dehydrogenase